MRRSSEPTGTDKEARSAHLCHGLRASHHSVNLSGQPAEGEHCCSEHQQEAQQEVGNRVEAQILEIPLRKDLKGVADFERYSTWKLTS